ncbi:MAG: glycosyl transferase group 1, partial [Hyphomicrobiales bacterium]|nr:glycosyl transferase group 1 [Hyphomicrobiales bacterium]
RVLLLTQFYPPIIGGEERHVRNLGAALAARGHKVSVATQAIPGSLESKVDGAVRVHRLTGSMQRLGWLHADSERRHAPPFPDLELALNLKRVIDAEKPDIVHAHNWIYASYVPFKRPNSPRLVVTLHDYSLVCPNKNFMHQGTDLCEGASFLKCLPCANAHYGPMKASLTVCGAFCNNWFAKRSVDCFIPVSHAVARHSRLSEGNVRFEVIPNFVPEDVSVLGPEDAHRNQLPREPFILFVGDMMRLKGIEVLLAAYQRLRDAPPLVLIGRRVPETPAEFGHNVFAYESWPHSAIMHAWKHCLFGVLPSTGPEACATVVIEAMASGKAVVASDIGGMPDLIDNHETGVLAPAGDAEALAVAMQSLIDDAETRQRMETLSLVRVRRLMANAVVSRIEQVYRDVLERVPAEAVQQASAGPLCQ